MPPRHTLLSLAVLVVGLVSPAAGGEAEKSLPAPTRQSLESLETQLDHAVDRVSLPHAARLLGRGESARGYRLPGYGIVFVLTPRALPGGEGQVYVLRRGSPTHRRLRVESREPGPAGGARASEDEEQIETLERQVLVLQHETESARREAEEEMDRIMQDVRVRVGVAPPSTVHVEVAPAEEAPPAPAPPAPPAPPSPAAAPLPPPPPPWKFWFPTGLPEEKRDPAAVVADVRAALIDALASEGGRLAGLGGEERLTVAVDFVVGGIFVAQARPEKTLVVSARVRDVLARARGAITPEELRRRVEVTEY